MPRPAPAMPRGWPNAGTPGRRFARRSVLWGSRHHAQTTRLRETLHAAFPGGAQCWIGEVVVERTLCDTPFIQRSRGKHKSPQRLAPNTAEGQNAAQGSVETYVSVSPARAGVEVLSDQIICQPELRLLRRPLAELGGGLGQVVA